MIPLVKFITFHVIIMISIGGLHRVTVILVDNAILWNIVRLTNYEWQTMITWSPHVFENNCYWQCLRSSALAGNVLSVYQTTIVVILEDDAIIIKLIIWVHSKLATFPVIFVRLSFSSIQSISRVTLDGSASVLTPNTIITVISALSPLCVYYILEQLFA